MTLYQIYEAVLTELNKVEAPVMLLEDFNYFYKKAVYQYCNLKYNNVEKDQQALDDLSFLYGTKNFTNVEDCTVNDYFHSLGCDITLKFTKAFKHYKSNSTVTIPATRYRSDYDLNRPFYKPSEKRVYYRFINSKLELFLPDDINITLVQGALKYLKTPTIDELTEIELDSGSSEDLPFKDYQVLEIINLIVKFLLENATDQRLQSFVPINQTIQ